MKNTFPSRLPPGSIVFTLDVCNLYGSIPIQEAIDSVMNLIGANQTKLNLFGSSLTDIRALLNHVLTNNYVRLGTNVYKQTEGIAMGNRVAPPVAIAFMHIFETGFMASLDLVPDLYVRYIDDILGVWTHGMDRLTHFFNCINTHNTSIRFTMDTTHSSSQLPFLDTLITVHPSGDYTTELYFKPMAAPIILHYTSAHPMTTKRAVLNAEMRRAVRVSSDTQATERSITLITHLFQQNGYPENTIRHAANNAKHKPVNSKKDTRPHTTSTRQNTDVYMRLPYIDETTAHRVNGILRGSKTPIRVTWTSGPTLGDKLVRSALSQPPCPSGNKQCHTCESGLQGKCTTKNVVYKITCKLCEAEQRAEFYVGECTRPVRYRFNEHLGDARLRKLDTPLGEHIVAYHLDLPNTEINTSFRIEILSIGRDCAEVKIQESLHIKTLKPTLNTMKSSWPLVR